jgi:hypothetical protein
VQAGKLPLSAAAEGGAEGPQALVRVLVVDEALKDEKAAVATLQEVSPAPITHTRPSPTTPLTRAAEQAVAPLSRHVVFIFDACRSAHVAVELLARTDFHVAVLSSTLPSPAADAFLDLLRAAGVSLYVILAHPDPPAHPPPTPGGHRFDGVMRKPYTAASLARSLLPALLALPQMPAAPTIAIARKPLLPRYRPSMLPFVGMPPYCVPSVPVPNFVPMPMSLVPPAPIKPRGYCAIAPGPSAPPVPAMVQASEEEE